MKAKEIVYSIKNLKAGGTQNQNESISDLQYLAILDYYRAKLIRQQVSAGYRLNERLIQDLGELHLEFDKGSIYVTKEIPNPIEAGSILITDVRDNYDIPYQKSTLSSVQWTTHSKFTKDTPKWFPVGRKIGVVNHASDNKLRVAGVFESPLEVLKFLELDNELDPLDFEYPLSNTMVDTIYKMIVEAEVTLLMNSHNDRLNDSNNENQN